MTSGPDATTLVYDADCGLCTWSMAKVLGWDRGRRLRPLALQDPEAERLLTGMNEEERMGSWHLVLPDGTVRSAGVAERRGQILALVVDPKDHDRAAEHGEVLEEHRRLQLLLLRIGFLPESVH